MEHKRKFAIWLFSSRGFHAIGVVFGVIDTLNSFYFNILPW